MNEPTTIFVRQQLEISSCDMEFLHFICTQGNCFIPKGPFIGTIFQMTKNVFEFNLNLIKQT
jgi:hypothetical protein